jgi:hypothetical protein
LIPIVPGVLMLWVRIPLMQGVLDKTLCDKVCQWLAAGRWFFLGTHVSSTNKTDCHDIMEILLKVVLNTIIHNLLKYTTIHSMLRITALHSNYWYIISITLQFNLSMSKFNTDQWFYSNSWVFKLFRIN